MKLKKISLFFLLAILTLSATSCKKKCKLDTESVDKGAIIEDVVLYPTSGYMTSNMGGNYVIDASSSFADNFEVSINGSERTAVNYANYTILAFPVTVKCNAAYERNVEINHTTQIVSYNLTVTQCDDCVEQRNIENYVLVETFPSTYTVDYNLTVVEK